MRHGTRMSGRGINGLALLVVGWVPCVASMAIGAEPASVELSAMERRLERAMAAARDAAVERLEEKIATVRRGGRVSLGSVSDMRTLGRSLRDLRRVEHVVPYMCFHGMEKGQIGHLVGGLVSDDREKSGRLFKVLQVVNGNTMLIEASNHWMDVYTYDFRSPCDLPLWVYGVDTAGITDGSIVHLPQLMQCTGTRTYPTPAGSRTVFMVEPFAIADPAELLEKLERRPRSVRRK